LEDILMRSKLVVAGLALASLFAAGMYAGKEVKASVGAVQVFRFAFAPSTFIFVPNDGLWHTVAAVSVTNRKPGGNVFVHAAGMSAMTPAGVASVTLDRLPDTRGPWIATFSAGDSTAFGGGFESWAISNVFTGNAQGPNRFFLNAFDFGNTGAETVEACTLAAFAMQPPLTEDCLFAPPTGMPGAESGPSNVTR
jgi:hypothetical protein